MNTTVQVETLFAELCRQETPDERRAYYLAHPILASPRAIYELTALVSKRNASIDVTRGRAALQELLDFREEISEGPRSYPLGKGPLERLWKQCLNGELREDRALALAASPELADILSEDYAHTVGFYCAVRSTEGEFWTRAALLHRMLLSAARACKTEDARAIRIRAEREWLVTACAVLMHVADGRAYKDAKAAGVWLVQTLDPVREREVLAESFHYLGILHLDPYTSFRNPANHELQHRTWLANTAQDLGPEAIEGIPTTREALVLAEGYLRRAVDIATGDYARYARKALIQTLDWRRALGESVDSDQRDALVSETFAALDPLEDPRRWLQLAGAIEASGGKIDEEKLEEIFSVSVDEWIERKGEQLTAEIVTELLSLSARRDPWRGLRVAAQGDQLVADMSREEQRLDFLNRQLGLFQTIAEQANVDLDDREEALRQLRDSGADKKTIAASLVALGLHTVKMNEEPIGLSLLDEAEALAPELTVQHARLFEYLRALLWLGVGSNAAKATPPRNSEAVTAYGNAINLYLKNNFSGQVLDLWRRVENLSQRQDKASASPILDLLQQLSLPSEVIIGEPVAAHIQGICRQLTITLGAMGKADVLPFMWQLAKGQRWAATLARGPFAAPGRDEHAMQILNSITAARSGASADELQEERITSDSPAFDAWLTSYVRTERYDGDRGWERVANLKMTFDERVAQLTSPRASKRPIDVGDLQGTLATNTALLDIYVGEHTNGEAAVYAVLMTSDEISAYATVPSLEGNEYEIRVGERSTVCSGVGLEVAGVRRALLEDPEAGSVVSKDAEEALMAALPRFFGALAKDLGALQAAGKDSLIVVPHDAFHFAPFHLFTLEGVPVADHWTVSYQPNITLLDRSARRHSRQRREIRSASIGLGFAGGDGGWTPIEEALVEAQEIANILGVAPVLDAKATKSAVVKALQHCTRVHIATHGALDLDAPAFHMLQLHPVDDEEGGLCAHEILNLDLSHLELVTLSACETALGRVDRSDNLRGLTAALFTAGVSTIVGTLWAVETQASQAFFTAFYRELVGGLTCRDAFRTAQKQTRAEFPQYRDWGAFYLAGASD